MAAVLVLTMQQPMGRGSRTATLANHPQPPPLPGHTPLAGRSSRRPGRGGGGRLGLRERGPPRPQTMGSHTRLVPGAVRLGATSKAFRAAPPGCQARLLHWIKVADVVPSITLCS